MARVIRPVRRDRRRRQLTASALAAPRGALKVDGQPFTDFSASGYTVRPL